jgi:hypothetical protein
MVESTGSSHMSRTHPVNAESNSVRARYTLRSGDTSADVTNPMVQGLPASAARTRYDLPQLQAGEKDGRPGSKSLGESGSQEVQTAGRQQLQVEFIAREAAPRLPLVSPPHSAWEARKEELRRLYLENNQPLVSVMERMKQQGFYAR